jgi:hypothetical protein
MNDEFSGQRSLNWFEAAYHLTIPGILGCAHVFVGVIVDLIPQ